MVSGNFPLWVHNGTSKRTVRYRIIHYRTPGNRTGMYVKQDEFIRKGVCTTAWYPIKRYARVRYATEQYATEPYIMKQSRTIPCKVVRYGMVHYGMVYHGTVGNGMVRNGKWYASEQGTVAWYATEWYTIERYSTRVGRHSMECCGIVCHRTVPYRTYRTVRYRLVCFCAGKTVQSIGTALSIKTFFLSTGTDV